MIRSAIATWKGSPVIGEGLVTTSSGVIRNALYLPAGASTGGDPCTSPSEMLAAAVASCMSMMLARETSKLGLKPEFVKTESILTLEEQKGRWKITGIELHVTAGLPERERRALEKASKNAKAHCPISSALNVPITVFTELEVPLHEPVGA